MTAPTPKQPKDKQPVVAKRLTEDPVEFAGFKVPIAEYVIAEGPTGEHQDLRFLQTHDAHMTVALCGFSQNNRYPTVILANVDSPLSEYKEGYDKDTLRQAANDLTKLNLSNKYAYIKTGSLNNKLAHTVSNELSAQGFHITLDSSLLGGYVTLDLCDGLPVKLNSLFSLDRYAEPHKLRANDYWGINRETRPTRNFLKPASPTLLAGENLREGLSYKHWIRENPITTEQIRVIQRKLAPFSR